MNASSSQLQRLQRIYDIHEAFIRDIGLACSKGCGVCCTRNVTLTSLEAALVILHLDAEGPPQWLDRFVEASSLDRFHPEVTINHLAELCIKDEPLPEEEMDPFSGPCPLLEDDICTVYPVRPFGCRAMVSTTVCTKEKPAQMPELVLTANNIVLQYLEAADCHGVTGNMIDVVLNLRHQADHEATDIRTMARGTGVHLLANRPIPALMVPPEHHHQVMPLLEALRSAFNP
jgi:Fe-S-cluster containining protein